VGVLNLFLVILNDTENDLIVILGPTASGKTQLAAHLAKVLNGEIISADSRQVYRGMDIGTGKDLHEYTIDNQTIEVHLINNKKAGEKYNIAEFQQDFLKSYDKILEKSKIPILSGGSGLYIQSVLQDFWQTQIPNNEPLRDYLSLLSKDEILEKVEMYKTNLSFDKSSKKRMIRALEILEFLKDNTDFIPNPKKEIRFKIFGLNPSLQNRRNNISKRLKERLENNALVNEIKTLLNNGVTSETLNYYGLEYKYVTSFILGEVNYSQMYSKLETEIHRFAKRQMTFFRSMEKKGFEIDWIPENYDLVQKLDYILKKTQNK